MVGRVRGVTVETHVPEIANHVPHFVATWDEGARGLTAKQVHEQLQAGDPPIYVLLTGPGKLTVSVWMMRGDEHRTVARRLAGHPRRGLIPAAAFTRPDRRSPGPSAGRPCSRRPP